MLNRKTEAALLKLRTDCKAGNRVLFDTMFDHVPAFKTWALTMAKADAAGVRLEKKDIADLPFAVRQMEYIYKAAVEAKFPNLAFADRANPLIKFDSEVPVGAATFTWYYSEGAGSVEYFSAMAADGPPSPTVMGAEQTGKIEGFHSEIVVTVQQLRRAAFVGVPLDRMIADADARAHAQEVNRVAAWGRDEFGIVGFLNHPQIASSVVPDGVAGQPTWASKTSAEIIADVLGLVFALVRDSERLFRPNIIALPGHYLEILGSRRISEGASTDSGMTIVREFLDKVLAATNNAIEWKEVEDLRADQSFGNLSTDGMMAFNDDPEFVTMVAPIFRLQQPVQQQGMKLITPVESDVGGIRMPYPLTAQRRTGLGNVTV